mmetsp:Transcript_126973/g.367547  ORF Transcript_126973/g.367547 Transcript_126973/m.367547 type:complete len:606 (-) Transcript_126973:5173-6990(-)
MLVVNVVRQCQVGTSLGQVLLRLPWHSIDSLHLLLASLPHLGLERQDGVGDKDLHFVPVPLGFPGLRQLRRGECGVTEVQLYVVLASSCEACTLLAVLHGVKGPVVLECFRCPPGDVEVACEVLDYRSLRPSLESAREKEDGLLFLPHWVDSVTLHRRPHDVLVLAGDLVDMPTALTEARHCRRAVVGQCLVPDIGNDVGVAARATPNVGDSQFRGLYNLQLQQAGVHGLLLFGPRLNIVVVLDRVHLLRGEGPRGLDKERALARAGLVTVLPGIRPRAGLVARVVGVHDGQREGLRRRSKLGHGRQPAFPEEVVPVVVLVPNLEEDPLPDIDHIHDLVGILLRQWVMDHNIQLDALVILVDVGDVVVGGGELPQGLAEDRRGQDAGHKLVPSQGHLGLPRNGVDLHVEPQVLRWKVAVRAHGDRHIEPLAIAGATVANVQDLALAWVWIVDLQVREVVVARAGGAGQRREQVDVPRRLVDAVLVGDHDLVRYVGVRDACGRERLPQLLRRLDVRVHGVGLDQQSVQYARHGTGSVERVVGDLHGLPVRQRVHAPVQDGARYHPASPQRDAVGPHPARVHKLFPKLHALNRVLVTVFLAPPPPLD